MKVCAVLECDRTAVKRDWCAMHYARWLRTGAAEGTTPQNRRSQKFRPCIVEDCERPHEAHGYCVLHGRRVKKHGDPHHAPAFYAPIRDRQGYVRIWLPEHPAAHNNRVHEHRVVMEGILGRLLAPGENVHHKNGVRHDNRPDNLELWVTTQPAGQRPSDLVTWAREIITRYGALVPEGR